jgi:hypothetical protein
LSSSTARWVGIRAMAASVSIFTAPVTLGENQDMLGTSHCPSAGRALARATHARHSIGYRPD